MAGTHGNAGQINSSSAKSALVGMTKTMSKEWGRYKVCVNCVAFGFIETRLTQPLDDHSSKIMTEAKDVPAGVPPAALSALHAMVPLSGAAPAEQHAWGRTKDNRRGG